MLGPKTFIALYIALCLGTLIAYLSGKTLTLAAIAVVVLAPRLYWDIQKIRAESSGNTGSNGAS